MPTALNPNLARIKRNGDTPKKKFIIGLASEPKPLPIQKSVAPRSKRIRIVKM